MLLIHISTEQILAAKQVVVIQRYSLDPWMPVFGCNHGPYGLWSSICIVGLLPALITWGYDPFCIYVNRKCPVDEPGAVPARVNE